MNTTNRVQLKGNLGNNPEIKIFENGTRLAKFSIATKETYYNREGEKVTNTQWHKITAWGKVAEEVEAQLQKGSFLDLTGKLTTRSYSQFDGEKKYISEIVASGFVLHVKTA